MNVLLELIILSKSRPVIRWQTNCCPPNFLPYTVCDKSSAPVVQLMQAELQKQVLERIKKLIECTNDKE